MEEGPNPNNGDSACSTPFVSAPSSPTHEYAFPTTTSGFFFSAPASPSRKGDLNHDLNLSLDFDFSSRFSPAQAAAAAMSSADELFHNGQIRPIKLSSLLLHPQALPPLGEADTEGPPAESERGREARLRSRSVHRKSRSMSPLRNPFYCKDTRNSSGPDPDPIPEQTSESGPSGPSVPAAASRSSSSSSTSSSSSSRSSRRWFSLKQLLNRSKSDNGTGATKEKETETTKMKHLFSFAHEKPKPKPKTPSSGTGATDRSPSAAAPGRRQRQSAAPARRRTAAERMYEARRAEAEEMRRRTALPYRQGHGLLLGCLGFGTGGAVHGLARGLNAVNAAAAAAASRS